MIIEAVISQNHPDYAETQKLLPAAFVRSTHRIQIFLQRRTRTRHTTAMKTNKTTVDYTTTLTKYTVVTMTTTTKTKNRTCKCFI